MTDREYEYPDMEREIAPGDGRLLIIGGNEDKTGQCKILREFVDMAGGQESQLAVITTAAEEPWAAGEEYGRLFRELGAGAVTIIDIGDREAANQADHEGNLEKATGIFFTGGDQLRLTSILGGSRADAAIRRAFRQGAVIAGTSAGASVMSSTMIIEGRSPDSPKKSALSMAHGLGLLPETVIDQHFAQRGRINRLLLAIAQNPHVLGVGVDEDTALAVERDGSCRVLGSKTVAIIDGKDILLSNVSELNPRDPVVLTNVLLHVLPEGYGFDLKQREPHISH